MTSRVRVFAAATFLMALLAFAYYVGGEMRIAAYGEGWAYCLDEAERQLVRGQ